MSTFSEVLKIELSELNTTESPPNSNFVKYNDWYYGTHKSAPWCVVFQEYCFYHSGMPLHYRTASCTSLMQYAMEHHKWISDVTELLPGDLLIIQCSSSKHIGLIEYIDGKDIHTIEGNTSTTCDDNGGRVMRQVRRIGKTKIVGAYRPEYDEEKEKEKDMTECETRKLIQEELGKLDLQQRYKYLKDVPKYYKDSVQKLINLKYLAGKGGKGDNLIIDLSEDACRLATVLDRAGVFNG